jgi:hypothetical protein
MVRHQCRDLDPIDEREPIRHHDKASIGLAGLCGNDGFNFGFVLNSSSDRLNSQMLNSRLPAMDSGCCTKNSRSG